MTPTKYLPDPLDGLPARVAGEYVRLKLEFLSAYLTYGLGVAKTKQDRVFVDLFAGPGRNVIGPDDRTGLDGSPLIALRARGLGRHGKSLTAADFIELHAGCFSALTTRVDAACKARRSHVPRDQIRPLHLDANREVLNVLAHHHVDAFIMVNADIEGPEDLPWSTLALLRTSPHRSLDLYVHYPLGGVNRLLPYKNPFEHEETLSDFFGTDEWKQIVQANRPTSAQKTKADRPLAELYRRQLGSLWKHVVEVERVRGRGPELYRMMLATSHPAAARVAGGIKAARAEIRATAKGPTLWDQPS